MCVFVWVRVCPYIYMCVSVWVRGITSATKIFAHNKQNWFEVYLPTSVWWPVARPDRYFTDCSSVEHRIHSLRWRRWRWLFYCRENNRVCVWGGRLLKVSFRTCSVNNGFCWCFCLFVYSPIQKMLDLNSRKCTLCMVLSVKELWYGASFYTRRLPKTKA